jgi:hypothetical protein
LDDPFVELYGARPPTTTINPNSDIDYVYTWGVNITRISTLDVNTPADSDHLGICLDIDLTELFGGKYGTLAPPSRRLLTLSNVKAKTAYTAYINTQWNEKNFYDRAIDLYNAAKNGQFSIIHSIQLQLLDEAITQTLLKGEEKCANRDIHRNPWSPKLCSAGKCLTYWKRKYSMARNKLFQWFILDKDRATLDIIHDDHFNRDISG